MKFLKMSEFRLLSTRIFNKPAFYRIKLNFLLTFYRLFTGQKTRNSVVRCYCQENKK
ncbi:phage protein [Listeria monocytogenes FSL N1-017]|uniref:gp73 n=1 Tax=Listeria phage B054 TaxID=330397 RepID=UPI00015C01E8|nr:gp73 [Listeria phage B054]AAY53178.1 gp73 [Listeria phage B054]EFK40505.1 phage protein [Listeria monocytogenes FSL N1-017]